MGAWGVSTVAVGGCVQSNLRAGYPQHPPDLSLYLQNPGWWAERARSAVGCGSDLEAGIDNDFVVVVDVVVVVVVVVAAYFAVVVAAYFVVAVACFVAGCDVVAPVQLAPVVGCVGDGGAR